MYESVEKTNVEKARDLDNAIFNLQKCGDERNDVIDSIYNAVSRISSFPPSDPYPTSLNLEAEVGTFLIKLNHETQRSVFANSQLREILQHLTNLI